MDVCVGVGLFSIECNPSVCYCVHIGLLTSCTNISHERWHSNNIWLLLWLIRRWLFIPNPNLLICSPFVLCVLMSALCYGGQTLLWVLCSPAVFTLSAICPIWCSWTHKNPLLCTCMHTLTLAHASHLSMWTQAKLEVWTLLESIVSNKEVMIGARLHVQQRQLRSAFTFHWLRNGVFGTVQSPAVRVARFAVFMVK